MSDRAACSTPLRARTRGAASPAISDGAKWRRGRARVPPSRRLGRVSGSPPVRARGRLAARRQGGLRAHGRARFEAVSRGGRERRAARVGCFGLARVRLAAEIRGGPPRGRCDWLFGAGQWPTRAGLDRASTGSGRARAVWSESARLGAAEDALAALLRDLKRAPGGRYDGSHARPRADAPASRRAPACWWC